VTVSVLKSLLIHTCTIQKNTPGAGSSSDYGHGTDSWADYATGVKCRLMPRPGASGWSAEQVARSTEGADMSYHTLFLEYRSDLMADGAEGTYRITNIQDANGTVIDAGPFDIKLVRNAGGQGHHLELALIRQPVSV